MRGGRLYDEFHEFYIAWCNKGIDAGASVTMVRLAVYVRRRTV